MTSLEIFNQKIDTQKDGTLPEAIDHLKEIHLSYKDNVITLNYAALSYCTPQKNQYAYMLEGFDKGWNYVGSQHSTTYTNLPAGTYTFRVKAPTMTIYGTKKELPSVSLYIRLSICLCLSRLAMCCCSCLP